MWPVREIDFTMSAGQRFRLLPLAFRLRLSEVFELLRQDPRRHRPGCDVRRLSGAANAWRLRVGDYRGIYAIEESKSFSPGSGTGRTSTDPEAASAVHGFSIGVRTRFPHSVQDPS